MLFRRRRQACLALVFPLVLVGTRHCVWSFFTGVGKAILLLLIASLLLFLVVRSADICRRLVACIRTLALCLFAPPAYVAPAHRKWPTLTTPRTPRLPLRFQLPPPVCC
jgi:hypothetical protein